MGGESLNAETIIEAVIVTKNALISHGVKPGQVVVNPRGYTEILKIGATLCNKGSEMLAVGGPRFMGLAIVADARIPHGSIQVAPAGVSPMSPV